MNKQYWFVIALCVAYTLLLLGYGCQETPKQDEDEIFDPANWQFMSYISGYVDSAGGIIHIDPIDSAKLARELHVESFRDSFWIIGKETLLVHLEYDTFGVSIHTWFPDPGDRKIYLRSYCGQQIPQRVVDRYENVAYRLWMKGTIPAHTVCAFHSDSGVCTEVYHKLTDVNYYHINAPLKPDDAPPPDAVAEIGPFFAWTCVQ